MANEISFIPIAYFECGKQKKHEASSQGTLDPQAKGVIDLKSFPQNSEMIDGLLGFSHLWILFVFHQNKGLWKPKVLPPRSDKKVGVFASRSPYRPCPIGMSAVRLEGIEGSRVFVSGHDLVDETPILDIKPYLTYADSFAEATSGWLTEQAVYQVSFASLAQEQLLFLRERGLSEFESALHQQLRFHPTDKRKKRVKPAADQPHSFIFSYRTWRVRFEVNALMVLVLEIFSGYSPAELMKTEDRYLDKALHQEFLSHFRFPPSVK